MVCTNQNLERNEAHKSGLYTASQQYEGHTRTVKALVPDSYDRLGAVVANDVVMDNGSGRCGCSLTFEGRSDGLRGCHRGGTSRASALAHDVVFTKVATMFRSMFTDTACALQKRI